MNKAEKTRILMESYMKHFTNGTKTKYQSKSDVIKKIDILIKDMKLDKQQVSEYHGTTLALLDIKNKLAKLPESISEWNKTYSDDLNYIYDKLVKIDSILFQDPDVPEHSYPYIFINGKKYGDDTCVTEILKDIILTILDRKLPPSPPSDLPF